jgi:hypothetical protein
VGFVGRCPQCRSPCPAALRPLGLAPPQQSSQRARPKPRGARGVCRPPERPPGVPPGRVRRPLLGLGRSAPPRVVGVRRPMPSWPTAVCPCGPSGSASSHAGFAGGPGVRFSLSVVPPWGALSLSAVAPFPGSRPHPLLMARPPPSRGPCSFRPSCGGHVGGHLGCSVRVACHVVRFVFSCSLGLFPGVAQPYSHCRRIPHGSRPGLGLSLCAPARVLCGSVFPWVHLSVRVGTWVCLPVIPGLLPTGRLCFTAMLLSPVAARWPHGGVRLRDSFPTRWLVVIIAVPVCPGLLTVALWASWPVLLSVCVWRSSSPPPYVSHPLPSDLHIARCLSLGAPPRRSLLTGLVTCRCLAPARHDGLSRFVSAWPCPVKPFSQLKTRYGMVLQKTTRHRKCMDAHVML